MYYRVLTKDGIGVYQAVDTVCPKDDPRRSVKPDGGWLPKVGPNFPGAISFWTEKGMEQYKNSGLFAWHQSLFGTPLTILQISEGEISEKEITYRDDYQIICDPKVLTRSATS